MTERVDGHLPIAGYGLVGDCRSVALVGDDGSIDWCSLPRFDSPSLFGRLLDAEDGGSWRLAPAIPYRSRQRYLDRTNVLQTIFQTDEGLAQVTDFMPVRRDTLREHARPHRRPRLLRIVTGLAGHVPFRHQIDLRPDYARRGDPLRLDGDRLHGDAGELHFCVSATLPLEGSTQEFSLGPGESVAFGLTVNATRDCGPGVGSQEDVRALQRETQDFWWSWAGRCTYDGPYEEHVVRSALTLKLMTYAPTGALVAAPTTSLPEWIGGARNWDYRFPWLRDASFTLYSLFELGYEAEAEDFMGWVSHLALERGVQNLYTLDGELSSREEELDHLAGYRGSRPVRVGNAAAGQLQLDVYGELLDCAHQYAARGGEISPELWRELAHVVDLAVERWTHDDASIWEVRGTDRAFTYSKAMCWVAVDRGIAIADATGHDADLDRWRATRRNIHRAVTSEGWSERLGSFTQSFGGEELDAALLRLPHVGFLPHRDERIKRTVDAIDAGLSEGPLVRRYDVEGTADGVAGGEGAFVMCAFWLAGALAHAGELEEAQRRFERLLSYASPLGLLAEEIHPGTGELLGNYPQAFSHLALISAAVDIERERRGTLADRPRLPVPAGEVRGVTTKEE